MILNASADWSKGELNVRGDMVEHFWTPDIIIHDLVSFYKPEIMNQVAALEVKRSHQLYYKVRSDMTMVCKGMKFHRFPLDEHVCYLKLTSFGYDDRRMKLDGVFYYDSESQRALPFSVDIRELSEENKVFIGSTSNYSVYGMEIRLSRTVSPYLLNVYLPTAIFVVMSWVSFLIPTDVVPARIVLLVTLCLVIINTFNNVTARIPVASQVTALEIWLLACILLVFGALGEYAFILRQVIQLSRKLRRQRVGSAVASSHAILQEFPDDRGHRDESYQMPSSLPPTSSEVFAPSSQSPKQQQFSTILTRAVSQDGGSHELTSPAVITPPSGPGQELRCRNSTANANFQNNQLMYGHHHHHYHHHNPHFHSHGGIYNTHTGGIQTGNGNGNRAGVASITTGQNSVDGGGGPVLFEEHHNNCVKAKVNASTSTSLHNQISGEVANSCDGNLGSLSTHGGSNHGNQPVETNTQSGWSLAGRIPNILKFRNKSRANNSSPAQQTEYLDSENDSDNEKKTKTPEQLMRTYQELVDQKALVVFPVAFLLFNIGYWLHYLINT